MKHRVLHVVDHLGFGGASVVIKSLIETMPAERAEHIVCALRSKENTVDIDSKGVTLKSHKYSLAPVKAIGRLCDEHHIDIVHAHLQKAILCSLLAAPRLTVPLILHEHGPVFRGGTGCIYRGFIRYLGTRARTIVANSQAAGQALQRVLNGADVPVVVVPNAVDLERFDPARYDGQEVRRQLGLGDDDFVVGFVGRLDRAKGPDILVEAAARLRDEQDECRFLLIGEGAERRRLEQQIKARQLDPLVTLCGLHANPAQVMRAFDVAVVPSRREAFGIVALEWMRMKVPVIVAPVGGLPEVVESGRSGVVLPRGDAPSIAEAIRFLRRDASRRETLIEAGFSRAETFAPGRIAERILNVYDDVTGRADGRQTGG